MVVRAFVLFKASRSGFAITIDQAAAANGLRAKALLLVLAQQVADLRKHLRRRHRVHLSIV